MENSIIELEKKFNELDQKVKRLNKKYEELEKKLKKETQLKPISINYKKNKEFIKHEKWISKQKSQYPNEIIAYIKKGKNSILIAHDDDEEILLKKIDELFDNREISEEENIFFR